MALEATTLLSIKTLFKDLPRLETERLLLRTMRLEDAADMYAYARIPEVSRYTLWEPHRSIEDARTFISCVIDGYNSGQIENWGLEHKATGAFIGTCGFFYWNTEHCRGEIQYAISPRYSRQGLMTEAVREVLRFGFTSMRLHRIEAKCMLDNTGSERVMQKAGMKFEGILRGYLFAKDSYHDLKSYAILKDEFSFEHRR